MKKFTKISLIIAAVLGGVGILLCGVSSVLGGGYRTIRRMAHNGELNYGNWHIGAYGLYYGEEDDWWESEDDWWEHEDITGDCPVDVETGLTPETDTASVRAANGEKRGRHGISYSYDISDIKSLELDVTGAQIYLREGELADKLQISVYNGENQWFSHGMGEMGTLEIAFGREEDAYIGNPQAKLVLEIPAGTQFLNMEMELAAVEGELALAGITCEAFSLDVDAGNIVAEGIQAANLTEIDVDAGNVELTDGTYQNVDIACNMGNVSLQGVLGGNLAADTDMGSIELDFTGNAEDYNYNFSCGLGEVNINGETYAGISGSRRLQHEGAVKNIGLECDMGSIDLTIE